MEPVLRTVARVVVALLAYGLAMATVTAPIAAERAVEGVSFDDRLGTLPVEVSLAHNGVTTLDTGILGRLYWERTGAGGFGASVRATGPPEAGGSLASYVSPAFVETNAQFVNDPDEVARVYGDEFRSQLWRRFLVVELCAMLLGGAGLWAAFRVRSPFPAGLRVSARLGLGALAVALGVAASLAVAAWLFGRWDGSVEPQETYPLPGVSQLSFSSPQTLEVASQVQPFIKKNTDRIRKRTAAYEAAADASLRAQLPQHIGALQPRSGERIVIAEADPQGSLVGTTVRTALYSLLGDRLGEDTLAVRTISGDITSNGTLAEDGFVAGEADASPDIPTVAVKGDHDTDVTVQQLTDHDVINPDFDIAEVAGLHLLAGNDPAFKELFGGLITNHSGVTEAELGTDLRQKIGRADADKPLIVLFHQPRSAAGYIGIDSVHELDGAVGRETVPRDDGIPDLPPGIINFGHLHDFSPPRVIWNTDGDKVTWTVLNQLGTSGGVEENPTFNRFSTPFSSPLKTLSVQLQYVNSDTGLQTGYARIDIARDGTATITNRIDLGLPDGQPGDPATVSGD